MWPPDPSCRKCERRPAGNAVLWSAQLAFLTARSCGGPRNLPASEEAPSTSEACGWTSDCRTTKEQEIRWLWHIKYCMCGQILLHLKNTWNVYALNLPVARTVHGLECKNVLFHRKGEHVFAVVLPVARCLPQFAVIDVGGGYFLEASSPVLILEKTMKPHKQTKSASWPAQVLYWAELNHNFWRKKLSYCNGNQVLWGYFTHLFILDKKKNHFQL